MKIVADDNIPQVENIFADLGELILLPGRKIQQIDLRNADILLTRSNTQVNADLLKQTAVKFVGSTVAGTDHLDFNYLQQNHIQYATAEGCNAVTVADYLMSCLALLPPVTLGVAAVIGVGKIGKLVAERLTLLGYQVLTCDPYRATENGFTHTPIEAITDCDLITIHTPLTAEGDYPTYHLIDKDFLARQKPNAILLNAGRGKVISFHDLKKYGNHLRWCLDVWEDEPNIDVSVLKKAVIATPHIAGHSLQSKLLGLEMIYVAMQELQLVPASKKQFNYPSQTINCKRAKKTWQEVVLSIFNPLLLTEKMRERPESFDRLRKNLIRHDFNACCIEDVVLESADEKILAALSVCF